jgi:hypothetical protein
MYCKCGYCFSKETLRAMQAGEENPYVSYLVVRDEDYPAFLRSELEASRIEDKESDAWAAAMWRSSQMAGSLKRCPKCARLFFLPPNGGDIEYYVAEE